MSDPRASITRTVLAPPKPTTASLPGVTPTTAAGAAEEVKLIGKRHGRMRSVNLSLTQEAKDILYTRAEADGTTLGEALMDLIAHADVPAKRRRPDRATTMRRGVRTVSVFVLLTPAEAREVVASSSAAGRSVSDFVSAAIG